MKALILIPARLESSRLPRKMLADIEGEPLIVRTWQQALRSRLAAGVVIATDSAEIAELMRSRGAEVVMTSPHASCGTERIAEAAGSVEGEVFVNLQGDEPLISPENIDLALAPFAGGDVPDCSTLVFPLRPDERSLIEDPHVVKVVLDRKGNALYFSRSPIPFCRTAPEGLELFRHVGLYAFRREVLQRFAALPVSMLEAAESLEQLRLLENGFSIRCVRTGIDTPGVNTPEELEVARRLFRERSRR